MKFIRKNILTAVFFSVFAILLGGALISCSNGSSSSDEDDDESSYGTKIYSESVTFSETPTQIVSAEMLADLSIKSLTIKVINVNYSGSDVWWFTAIPGSDAWNNEAKLEWQSGEGANSLYLATITDAAAIAAYKANGIYIAGTNSATASVSVFYVEGEAEESNASSGSSSQTENNGNSSSENESNGNSDGNSSSGNENTGTSDGSSSNENEDNGSSSEEEWTLIKESIDYTGNGNLIQIIKNTDISTQQISKLKITLTNYTKQDDDWITASADETWTNKSENIQNYPDNYEISDTDFISEFLTNGLYIGSTSKLTCKISIYYK